MTDLSPLFWFTVVIQGIGISVTVGLFIQQHRDHGRRIRDLEETAVRHVSYSVEIRRLDEADDRLEAGLARVQADVIASRK